MLKSDIHLKNKLPLGREKAALIAHAASRFQCTLTLEKDGIVLNVKSMIGLLSQSIPKDGEMTLIADGEDEAAASAAILDVVQNRL